MLMVEPSTHWNLFSLKLKTLEIEILEYFCLEKLDIHVGIFWKRNG